MNPPAELGSGRWGRARVLLGGAELFTCRLGASGGDPERACWGERERESGSGAERVERGKG